MNSAVMCLRNTRGAEFDMQHMNLTGDKGSNVWDKMLRDKNNNLEIGDPGASFQTTL